MTTLVVGASGETGRLLVEQLLNRGELVRIIVRSGSNLPEAVRNHPNLSITQASITEMNDTDLTQLVTGCEAVASCLGHTLSLKGIYGQPRRLVTDTARRICSVIQENTSEQPVKYVLMNTTGNKNRDLKEPTSFRHNAVIGLLRLLLPPHVDNEKAANFLRTEIGQNHPAIEWVAVRPDGLIDNPDVSEYDLHPSPIRDPIFNSGQTSRINVAHFMATLINDADSWTRWQGQMPVIYNRS
ncbi:NAD(P)-dependent oxidoreductase [Amphritea japonica]|uniref:NAD(P)-binding domain-containing protein n=1 Tax=Amphritea japonica ATCC BAA-1530 TaxID=1278309 RepID=A0A7R6PF60_9GAMM|nr:NAD(P)-binding oxidoreductase [Amphritea japonica]BBB25302.1 conserved hypothetical protein [Amphritea japonica ATCC BAA-1530]